MGNIPTESLQTPAEEDAARSVLRMHSLKLVVEA